MKISEKKLLRPMAVKTVCFAWCALTCITLFQIPAVAQTPPASVDTNSRRAQVAFTRTGSGLYDYVPSVMKQGGYRMWWCGGISGDFILYAESDSINGPWHQRGGGAANTYNIVYSPTEDGQSFDSQHTCDPSVVLIKGTYYLYYGGLPAVASTLPRTTRMGVASSANGFDGWTQLNSGNAIVVPSVSTFPNWATSTAYTVQDTVSYLGDPYRCREAHTAGASFSADLAAGKWKIEYGAGQPSVVNPGDGWIYMFFTDSTASGANPYNGSGIFALRSTDPTFQSNTQELRSTGWVSVGNAAGRDGSYRLRDGFSVDALYSDVLQSFIIASHQAHDETRLYLYSADLLTYQGLLTLPDVAWTEGPGVARSPEGRALPGGSNALGRVPIDILFSYQAASTVPPESGWDLYHVGYDLIASIDQTTLNGRVGSLFRGWKVVSSGLPLVYVSSEGTRLQCALSAPPALLTANSYSLSSAYFYTIPFGASLFSGNTCWGATGRPAAFLLDDDRLWPVNNASIVTANGSSISTVSTPTYDLKDVGPALFKTQW